MCRWRRTLDFDFWDLGRVSHLEEENNGSQLAGACLLVVSTSLRSMWATFQEQSETVSPSWCEYSNTNSQIIMFHLHSLIGSSPRVVQIVFVLTFTWGWIWKQIWKPLWAWRLLILVKSIHTLKGQTLVHLAASLRFNMFVFCFASDELPVSQTSLTCRSFLFLVPLEWILINKDGFPNKSRGETFYIEQLVKVSAAPLPWSEPSVQKVIMFIVC